MNQPLENPLPDHARPPLAPPVPRTIEDTGLDASFLVDLLVKHLSLGGRLKLHELAARLCLPAGVIDPLLGFMRAERLCEVPQRGEMDMDLAFGLTESGRQRAAEALEKNRYTGPAPVPLTQYVAQVNAQSVRAMGVQREQLARVFENVVVEQRVLDTLGPALNSGRAIFLYGPSGSGKTFLAEKLVDALAGLVFVPHALAVGGEVLQVFDPLVHRAAENPAARPLSLDRMAGHDARWTLCHRPVVQTGGELSLRMLDLEFEPTVRFYSAPPQLKANNGLFIVDDLGRQLVPPRELMNRWIVPLDRRIDYLALHTGAKFQVPFDVVVVFSSNLRPADLADDAFLRRLGYKLHIGALDDTCYSRVLQQACARLGVAYSDAGLDYLLHDCHRREGHPLLATVPWDIAGQLRDRAVFEGGTAVLTPAAVRWAWDNCFCREEA